MRRSAISVAMTRPSLRRASIFCLLVVVLAGCTGGAGGPDAVPTPQIPTATPSPTPASTPTQVASSTADAPGATTGTPQSGDFACEIPTIESESPGPFAFPEGYSAEGAASSVGSLHLDRAASLSGYRLETNERSQYRDQTHRFDIARPEDGPWEAYWQHYPIMPENRFGYYIDDTDVMYNENGYYANEYDARYYTRGVKIDPGNPGPKVAYFDYEINEPRNREKSPFYHGANSLIEVVSTSEETFAGTAAVGGDRTAIYRITGFTTSDEVTVNSGYYAVDDRGLVREMCVQWNRDTVLSFAFSQIGDTDVRVPDWYETAKNKTSDGELPEAAVGRTVG